MKKLTIFKKFLFVVCAALIGIISCFDTFYSFTVKAEMDKSKYSDVLFDLEKDENFDATSYPTVDNDYSLQVIQIAESVGEELFVYVYQPSHNNIDFVATSISMYVGYSVTGDDFQPKLYNLTLVSTNGVFDKYVVNDYSISEETERWYNIVSIFRKVNNKVDENIIGGTTDEKAYSVGQQWHVYYFNDNIVYEMGTFKTMDIDIVTVGNITYTNGFTMGNLAGLADYCDSHFICFNVPDYIVKHIYDADVTYVTRVIKNYGGLFAPDDYYGEYRTETVTLYDTDTVTFEGAGWLGKTYKWNRISSSFNFVSNFEKQGGSLNKTSKSTILSSQWVFSFCETEINVIAGEGWSTTTYTEVSEVTILRLHFVDITGKYYNLGVVSDKVTEDEEDDGKGGINEDPFKYLGWLLLAGCFIGLCIVIGVYGGPILKIIGMIFSVCVKFTWKVFSVCVKFTWKVFSACVKSIWNVFSLLIKSIWRVICFPFKLLGELFHRNE